jgi:hypothetical protein
MHNSFDFGKFEKQLLEALQRNEKFIKILAEEETAAEKAKKMGLTSMGFGRWGKDDKVTHKTSDGKLEPIKAGEEEKDQDKKEKSADTKSDTKTKEPEKKAADKKPEQKKSEEEKANPEAERLRSIMPGMTKIGRPLSTVPPEQLKQVSTRIKDLADRVNKAKAAGEAAEDFDLCQISIPGTNLYCGDHKGIDRVDMPQFKGTPRPGSDADKLAKDPKSGEVDTEAMFRDMLEKQGIKVSEPEAVPPESLKATQRNMQGTKVAGMAAALAENPEHPAITAPIYVSRDGYVLDGHHRWAAIVAHNAGNPDKPIPMRVRVIDDGIESLVQRSNKFADDIGIERKSAPGGSSKPKEEPKKGFTRRMLDRVKSWGKKQKEEAKAFFEEELHKGKTPERRSLVQKTRDKVKGALKDVKHELKHEAAVFRDAGRGLQGFFRGKGPNEREKKAMKSVATKVVMTAVVATGLGAAAGGAAALGKAVLIEFIPHVVGESILKGAGRAALFAGPEDQTDDAMMEKFIELVLKNMEEMDIPDEVIEKAFMKYKGEE